MTRARLRRPSRAIDGAIAVPRGRELGMIAITSGALALLASFSDGAALYKEHCASCHGKDGGGDGLLAADLRFKPRAFKEGKFAFGNTPEAMAKTVMSGVPGQDVARMPAFKSILSEDDVHAVVEYVRTLMPQQAPLTAADMEMEPRDGALIVRGILAPLEKGGKPIARGLLVGLPSGFSFEYDTEQLRLIAVRRGGFVRRSDWEGRGGRPLTPLGTAIWTAPALESWTPFALAAPADAGEQLDWKPATAKLRQTCVREGVELKYDLVDPEGRTRAHVIERPSEVVLASGVGMVQELQVFATDEPVAVRASLAIPMSGWVVKTDIVPTVGESSTSQSRRETQHHIDAQFVVADQEVRVRRTILGREGASPEELRAMVTELDAMGAER